MPDIRVEISLTLLLDSDRISKPANWDWPTLLDLGGEESVEVTAQRLSPHTPELPDVMPSFDGDTFQPAFDQERLGEQMRAVYQIMADGRWWTLGAVALEIDAPEASVSARLRDLRKSKFGGFQVERRRSDNGLHRYRLIVGDDNVQVKAQKGHLETFPNKSCP